MSDQRDHPRVPVRQRVWCEGQNVTLYVQALNVSRGGLFVRTANPPSIGDFFRVSFNDLEDGEVVVRVEVMWSRRGGGPERPGAGQPGIGLRIVEFEKGANSFARFLARQLDAGASCDED